MSFRSKAKFSLLFFFLFATFIFIIACFYSHSMYQDRMEFSTQEKVKHIPKILEDLKAIQSAKIFLPITFEKNALDTVSNHVVWDGADSALPATSVSLFRKHPDHLKTEKGFQELINDPAFQNFNAEWIRSLKKYDHLDLTTHVHVKSKLEQIQGLSGIERIGIHATLPLIDFMDLVNQATIFAIKESVGTSKNKREALQTFHHVAQLVVSNPSLVAQMAGVVALRREYFLSQKFGVTVTPGLNNETIDRMKRVGFAWPGIISLNETNSLPSEIKLYMKPELMVCGAAGEIPFTVMLSDFLEPQWPLEPSFKENLDSNRSMYTKLAGICHTESYLVYLKPIESKISLFNWSTQNIPYVRRTVGSLMLSIATPSFMRLYDDLDEKRTPPSPEDRQKVKKALELLTTEIQKDEN